MATSQSLKQNVFSEMMKKLADLTWRLETGSKITCYGLPLVDRRLKPDLAGNCLLAQLILIWKASLCQTHRML
jgi:hypothetical protein